MNWGQVRDAYVTATGGASSAMSEAILHLNEGHRRIRKVLNLSETISNEEGQSTTAGVDFIAYPPDLVYVVSLVNIETGQQLVKEPDGMRGRARYFEPGTAKPAQGPPFWFCSANRRVYLRPTPDKVYPLQVIGKFKAPSFTVDAIEQEPPIPEDYHMAIALAAAVSYLTMHPDANKQLDETHTVLQALKSQLAELTQEALTPEQFENFAKVGRYAMPFRFGRR